MTALLVVFVAILGAIIGSFLNVVILRYNTGFGLTGRSGCFSCGKTLTWYELIPVISFVIQGGRCRKCHTKLSWQYPLVELLTAIVFVISFSVYGISLETLFQMIVWSLLIVILVYDLRHKIIPDGLVYSFAALALIRIFLMSGGLLKHELAGWLWAGPILFAPFFLLWLISGGRWIGLGDGKLALGMGWMLGLGLGVSAIILSFWVGAVLSLALLLITRLKLRSKKLTMKSEIPFAPFLILGLALVNFLQIDVVGIYRIFGI